MDIKKKGLCVTDHAWWRECSQRLRNDAHQSALSLKTGARESCYKIF